MKQVSLIYWVENTKTDAELILPKHSILSPIINFIKMTNMFLGAGIEPLKTPNGYKGISYINHLYKSLQNKRKVHTYLAKILLSYCHSPSSIWLYHCRAIGWHHTSITRGRNNSLFFDRLRLNFIPSRRSQLLTM